MLECDTGEAAEQTLDLWLNLARNSGLKEFEACCDTIEEWKAEILQSFDCPYTNGYTEGCNNRIKVLKRNAYGYRNFDVSEIASCICFPARIGGEKWKKLSKMGSRKNKGIYYTTK